MAHLANWRRPWIGVVERVLGHIAAIILGFIMMDHATQSSKRDARCAITELPSRRAKPVARSRRRKANGASRRLDNAFAIAVEGVAARRRVERRGPGSHRIESQKLPYVGNRVGRICLEMARDDARDVWRGHAGT